METCGANRNPKGNLDDSNITPEKFWQYALETSNECKNNDSGVYVGRIINPQGLIQKIQANKTVE